MPPLISKLMKYSIVLSSSAIAADINEGPLDSARKTIIKYNQAKNILEKYNQTHLLKNYEKLNNSKKEYLLNQITNINFELINKLYLETKKEIEVGTEKIEPIKYIEKEKISEEEKEKYLKIGEEEIKKGKLAVVTMAGGQGTRLRT